MRRSLVLGLALLVGGCAAPNGASQSDVDQAQMSLVDRTASDRGVKVYWVNPPRKTEGPEAKKPGG